MTKLIVFLIPFYFLLSQEIDYCEANVELPHYRCYCGYPQRELCSTHNENESFYCTSGFYGMECRGLCGVGVSQVCLNGGYCNRCVRGTYRERCAEPYCGKDIDGHCDYDKLCNTVNGTCDQRPPCDKGVDGWCPFNSSNCPDKHCNTATGNCDPICNRNVDGYCMNGHCNILTGVCDSLCAVRVDGYCSSGTTCNTESGVCEHCNNETENCDPACKIGIDGYCMNGHCNTTTGLCDSLCAVRVDGYCASGTTCNTESGVCEHCNNETENCDPACEIGIDGYCMNGHCNTTTGLCESLCAIGVDGHCESGMTCNTEAGVCGRFKAETDKSAHPYVLLVMPIMLVILMLL